ncbi:hypothetical protein EC991_009983 [Linnemannia zychae]|nr:hypothetical protein EC991_009983 [Linnemannia zychae]
MPYLGQFKAIAILLLGLCTFASFFYFKVWSSIDTDNENGVPIPSADIKADSPDSVIFRQQHHHQHQSKQSGAKQESQQLEQDQINPADSGFDGAGRPFLVPDTELRPMMDPINEDSKAGPKTSLDSIPITPSQTPPRKSRKQRERERLRQEKAERKRLKEENAERKRLREERRRKKAAKLLRLQQLDKEPYPALISTNNARLAALNLKAFARFCHSKAAQDRIATAGQQSSPVSPLSAIAATVGSETEFATYEDWVSYIHNKNTGQEQEQAITPPQNLDSPDLLLKASEKQGEDAPAATGNPPKRQQRRPLFMERPLPGWVINHTAILEPCDRTLHTSAHCLEYLTKEHLYLIPSREARSWPNRIVRHPSQPATSGVDAIMTHNEAVAEGAAIDGYQRETGSGSDGRVVTTTSTITTTATTAGTDEELEEADMMDFHIFWQGVITDKLSLSAHSFLFSQPLDRARLHLWIDSSNLPEGMAEDYQQNIYAKDLVSEPLNKYIKFHVWDQAAQHAFAYPVPPTAGDDNDVEQLSEEGGVDSTSNTPTTPPVALSDEARFLILNRYGGMYLDADVLLLRDMSPFYDAEMEFAYEWSNTLMYNTAILRLNKGSSVARRILDGATAREKEIQEKKMRKAMKGSKDFKVKITKDGATGVDPLRLEKVPGRDEYKDKKRVRGGNSKAVKQSLSAPVLPSPVVAPLPVAAPSSGEQIGYENGEDDALGSSDGDSLFAATIDPTTSGSSMRRHHHHHRRHLSKRGEMRPNEIYHPARLRGYLRPQDNAIENNGLTMMPVAVFDPLWLRVDDAEPKVGQTTDRESTVEDLRTFPDAFSSASNSVCPQQQEREQREGESKEKKGFTAGPEVFVMGAYAYHWHNNWLTPIEAQSWMGLMKEAYAQFLAGERPNLYGEWFRGDSDAFLF